MPGVPALLRLARKAGASAAPQVTERRGVFRGVAASHRCGKKDEELLWQSDVPHPSFLR